MDQSASPASADRASSTHHQEQHVSFENLSHQQHHHEQAPFSSKAGESQDYEEEEEEIDEEEEELAFEERLLEAQRRNHQGGPSPVSAASPRHHHPATVSPPDSMDSSNDFVKLEKPRDLFNAQPELEVHLVNRDEEITPSDDVAPPMGDDLSDFAPSPQDAAHDLADRAHQTLEQFIATSVEASGQGEPSFRHRTGESAMSGHRVTFSDDDEDTFRRQGPLTLGQPVEAKSLHRETNIGLHDNSSSESPSVTQKLKASVEDAAAVVGEFASRITQDAQAGAFRAKEIMEHGALLTKEAFEDGATAAKEVAENLLDFEETTEGDAEIEAEGRSFSMDQPETPIILPPARPPTPPKPRAADAPETPPILDLGGPAHPHTQFYPPYQRKPSLKITPGSFGLSSAGTIQFHTPGAKGPSWFDMRHWDKNVLDLIYWRDVKKSGIVFGVTLALLICLATFNIITVVSYVSLLVLSAALGYRIYTSVMATVNKTEHKNPFQPYLEKNLDLPQDRVHEQTDVILKHTKDLIHQLRRLFFVEDLFDTLKFALLLWALTYVGAYLSGTALIILAFVGLFTLPKVYEMYQPQIDEYYGMVESKVKHASQIAREQLDKVPFLKKQKPQEKNE